MKRAILPLILISILLPTVLSAQAWRGRGRVTGKVVDEEGAAVAGAKLIFHYEVGGGGPTTESKDDGKFTAVGLQGGQWQIEIEAEGFMKTTQQVEIKALGSRPYLEITLPRPRQVRKENPEAAKNKEQRAILAEADAAFKAGDFSAARAGYEKVLVELPELHELKRSIAFCHYREGSLPQAIELLEQTTAIDPVAEDMMLLANLHLQSDNLDGARATLDAVAALDSTQVLGDPQTYTNVGVLLYNQQLLADAVTYFERAIAADSSFALAYYYRGLAHVQAGRNDAAKADFGKYLELSPDGPNADAAREVMKML